MSLFRSSEYLFGVLISDEDLEDHDHFKFKSRKDLEKSDLSSDSLFKKPIDLLQGHFQLCLRLLFSVGEPDISAAGGGIFDLLSSTDNSLFCKTVITFDT